MSESTGKSITKRLFNGGIHLGMDVSAMQDGQMPYALDVTSDQEGSICSRTGLKYLGRSDSYTAPYVIAKWRVEGLADSAMPRYIGDGTSIVRTTNFGSFAEIETDTGASLDKPWSSVVFSSGGTSDSTFYFATPAKMRKVAKYGDTTLARWGLFPPSRAVAASAVVPDSLTITAGAGPTGIDSTTAYTNVVSTAVSLNLGEFASGVPSGSVIDLYDCDDYIEVGLAITGLTSLKALAEIKIELDCNAGTYADCYVKGVVPSALTGFTQGVDSSTTTSEQALKDYYGTGGDDSSFTGTPVILPPFSGSYTDKVRVRKSEFLKVGAAGTSTKNWSSIGHVRVRALASSLDSGSGPSITVTSFTMKGGSGPNSTLDIATPYKYVYTFRDPKTWNESNPCVDMIRSKWVEADQQPIKLTLYGTDDAAVTGAGSIAIYRAGGSFADGLYRLVGYAINPGIGFVDFYDRSSDEAIQSARTVSFDNDPPVPSSLTTPFVGNVAAVTGDGSGIQTWAFSSYVPAAVDLTTIIGPGSRAYISNGASTEEAIIETVYADQLSVNCQNQHVVSAQNPLTVTVEVRAGAPCHLSAVAFESVFLAGDPLNPDTIYKSATGRPESFPFASGQSVNRVKVGSAANPVMNITEFGGVLLSMNRNTFYTLRVWNGVLQSPENTAASRGLAGRWAWCKVGNEIWYMAHDGIYAFGGGESRYLSGPISWMFRKRKVNGVAPIDFSLATRFKAAHHENKVYFCYVDTDGNTRRLVYDVFGQRWNIDSVEAISMLVEEDTGAFVCGTYSELGGVYGQFGMYGTTSTTDFFNTAPGDDGFLIGFSFKTGVFDFESPDFLKLFTSLAVDLTKEDSLSTLTLNVYYDYATSPGDTFVFSPDGTDIHLGTARTIYPLPLQKTSNSSRGKEAKAIQLEFVGTGCRKKTTIHAVTCNFIPLERIQAGDIWDWSDVGHPWDKRLSEILVDYDAGIETITLYVDVIKGIAGSTQQENAHNFTLTGRGQVSIPAPDGIVAKKFRLRSDAAAALKSFVIYKAQFVCENYPPDTVLFTEYSDYGHPHEKRFLTLSLNVDTNGKSVVVLIEGDGTTKQTITVSGTAANRVVEIPVSIDVIARQVRLKVSTIPADGKFQLFGHKFDQINLPPDVVYQSDYSDFGYDYSKYVQAVTFDVNTNGQTVPVRIYADGAYSQVVNVTSTFATRNQQIALNPAITAKSMKFDIDPVSIPIGGRFQLWDFQPVFKAADKGPISHTTDWDALNHPYDKDLKEVTIEFETGGANVHIALDTLTGINGNTVNLAVQTLILSSTGRGLKTFALPVVVAKMVRLRSLGTNGAGTHSPDFKMWSYVFKKDDRPADIVPDVDPSDLGYPCDKIFRGLGVQIDTGGVACVVKLWVDGVLKDQWSVTTTDADRSRFLTPSGTAEIIGKLYSLTFEPGNNGKGQLYEHNFDVSKDACEFRFLDSGEQAMGQAGFRYLKQCWIDYKCAGSVTLKVYVDNNVLFYTKTLPAQSNRNAYRFYLPSAVGSVLNKSRKHRITLEAVTSTLPFKIYRDSSRAEYLILSGDARASYGQFVLWQDLRIAV